MSSDFDRQPNKVSDALLRCPFCGGEPEATKQGRYIRVQCGQCGTQSNGFTIAALARDAWNNRDPRS